MSNSPELIQGSQEWLDMRRTKIGSSDAPIIMDESPYGTPYQLWEEKLGLRERAVHAGMIYGTEKEDDARKLLEKEVMCEMPPAVIYSPMYPWMVASLDALNVDERLAAEIKNPNQKDHDLAKEGIIPRKYYPQVQHQLVILFDHYGITELLYYSHRNGDTATVKVQLDDDYVKLLVKKEKQFFDAMQNFIPPKLTERDYDKLPDEAIPLAHELCEIIQQQKDLKQRETDLRARLIEQANGKNCMGGGLRMTRVVSKGSVDYKSIPQLDGVNLDDYRKPAVESWRFTARAND